MNLSHPWISTVCHLCFSKIRSEMILSHWWSRNTFVFSMSVEKFDHTRIVSDTSFLILKCNQCLFFHQITNADPPKSLEILQNWVSVETLPKWSHHEKIRCKCRTIIFYKVWTSISWKVEFPNFSSLLLLPWCWTQIHCMMIKVTWSFFLYCDQAIYI